MDKDFKKSFFNGVGGFLSVIIIPLIGLMIWKVSSLAKSFFIVIFAPELKEFRQSKTKAYKDWLITLISSDYKKFERIQKFMKKNPKSDKANLEKPFKDSDFVLYRQGMCGMSRTEKKSMEFKVIK